MAVMEVELVRESRGGSIQTGDRGNAVSAPSEEGYLKVFWPTRHCSTIEHLGKDVREVPEKYPEHAKLTKVKDKSQAIGEFLEFGLPFGVTLAHWVKYCPRELEGRCEGGDECTHTTDSELVAGAGVSIQSMLARYFDIDEKKLDEEKRAMLEEVRAGK
jgi:hypothetical protein